MGCHRHWEIRWWFRARCRHRCGGQFAIGPNGAICEVLLLPNGHRALEGIDREAASVNGGGAVRRANGYEQAGFTDFKAPEAVNHGDSMNTVFIVELRADFAHFGQGHGFIRLVIEVKSRAIVGLIANEAIESDNGAVFRGTHVANYRGHLDGLAHQLVDIIVASRHWDASAAAHGRDNSEFVTAPHRPHPIADYL